jgi:hypothetical protein
MGTDETFPLFRENDRRESKLKQSIRNVPSVPGFVPGFPGFPAVYVRATGPPAPLLCDINRYGIRPCDSLRRNYVWWLCIAT